MSNSKNNTNDENITIFEYYRKYGLVKTCDKFTISEKELMTTLICSYGEECNNITSCQIKSAIRNIHS